MKKINSDVVDTLKKMPFISDIDETFSDWKDFYHADKLGKAEILVPAISIPVITGIAGYLVHRHYKRKRLKRERSEI